MLHLFIIKLTHKSPLAEAQALRGARLKKDISNIVDGVTPTLCKFIYSHHQIKEYSWNPNIIRKQKI